MDIKLGAIVLDSADSEALSDFYSKFLGWVKFRYDDEWIIVRSEKEGTLSLVFQQVECYRKPHWPAEKDKQQQMLHLDFYVDEVAPAVEFAIACGAELSPVQLEKHWRVLLDPAGHPFCILPNKPPDSE